MSEQISGPPAGDGSSTEAGRELLPVLTADEVRRLVIQLTTLAGHVPSAADEAEELIALLGERIAPSGVLKRYALWVSPWQGGQLMYRITRRDRAGFADALVARFVGEPMDSGEAIAYGRVKAVAEYAVPEDELDIHALALPKPAARGERVTRRRQWARVRA